MPGFVFVDVRAVGHFKDAVAERTTLGGNGMEGGMFPMREGGTRSGNNFRRFHECEVIVHGGDPPSA